MTQFHGKIEEEVPERIKDFRCKNTPAFPVNVYEGHTKDGMTLRDYFAAKAMQGMVVSAAGYVFRDVEHYAKKSYLLADAMMKARDDEPTKS